MFVKQEFEPDWCTTLVWSGPENQQNKTDMFLSIYGVIYTIMSSRKHEGKY